MQGWLDIAAIVAMSDFNGSFVVKSTPELPFLLREGMTVFLAPPILDMPRSVEAISVSNTRESSAKVRFSGIDAPDDAERLVGRHLLVRREAVEEALGTARFSDGMDILADADIRSLDELIGWQLQDEQGCILGEVARVEENPAHPFLIVEKEQGDEAMIPMVVDFIAEADPSSCTITVCLPKGLLDI